jgi:hypothetical protein
MELARPCAYGASQALPCLRAWQAGAGVWARGHSPRRGVRVEDGGIGRRLGHEADSDMSRMAEKVDQVKAYDLAEGLRVDCWTRRTRGGQLWHETATLFGGDSDGRGGGGPGWAVSI